MRPWWLCIGREAHPLLSFWQSERVGYGGCNDVGLGPIAGAATGAEQVGDIEGRGVAEAEVDAQGNRSDFVDSVLIEAVKGFDAGESVAGGGDCRNRETGLETVAAALAAGTSLAPDYVETITEGHAGLTHCPAGCQLKLDALVVIPVAGAAFAFTVSITQGSAEPRSKICCNGLANAAVSEIGKIIREAEMPVEIHGKGLSGVPPQVVVLPGLKVISGRKGCGHLQAQKYEEQFCSGHIKS